MAGDALTPATVRTTVGSNVRRVRKLREMTGRQLVSRLETLGVKLLPSGLTAVEKGDRRLTAEELLIFAIALNTSVIDLLTPADGSALKIAEGVDPLPWSWLEAWLSGETPCPSNPTDKAYVDEFFETASDPRKVQHRVGMRPEIQEIDHLRSVVSGAIEGPGTPLNEIDDPKLMAELIREVLGRVDSYVKLLADKLEQNGYGPR